MTGVLDTGAWSDAGAWDDTATWLDAASSGGGLDVILGAVTLLTGRTIKPVRTDTEPQEWRVRFNPADRQPLIVDLSDFLSDEGLAALTGFDVDVVAANMGVIKGTGDYRPRVDLTNKRLALWPQVDPSFQGPSYFAAPVKARLIFAFATSATPPEAYRRSGYLTIAQVL